MKNIKALISAVATMLEQSYHCNPDACRFGGVV